MDVEKDISGLKDIPQIITLQRAVDKLIHLLCCLPKKYLIQI